MLDSRPIRHRACQCIWATVTALRLAWSLILKRFPPSGPLVVPFDEGRSRIYADMRTAFGRQLYRYRGNDPDLAFVRAHLQPGEVFVDGGAHVGMFTLVAASAVGPDGMVCAFEPNPETFEMLRRNVELNGLMKPPPPGPSPPEGAAAACVKLHEEALGDREGEAAFTVMDGDRAPWSHLGEGTEAPVSRTVKVRVTTLSSRIPREDWDRIGLIKLDLEGAEPAALRGMTPLLGLNRPDMLIELAPEHLARCGEAPLALVELLRGHGYDLLQPTPDPLRWRRFEAAGVPELPAERPNLLVTCSIGRLAERGIRTS